MELPDWVPVELPYWLLSVGSILFAVGCIGSALQTKRLASPSPVLHRLEGDHAAEVETPTGPPSAPAAS
jgi:hypothetical protein